MIKKSKNYSIQSSKDILGGEPVFRGTRVPIKAFMDYLKAGDNLSDFLEDFPTVTKKQTLEVLALAELRLSKK